MGLGVAVDSTKVDVKFDKILKKYLRESHFLNFFSKKARRVSSAFVKFI
jgi:hypothetical protein